MEGLLPGSPISWGMTFLLFTGATTPLIRYCRHDRSSLSVARARGADTQMGVCVYAGNRGRVGHRAVHVTPEGNQ